jgi:O-6-methylguanine DNA methyltransferase
MTVVPFRESPVGSLTMVFENRCLLNLLFDDDPWVVKIKEQNICDEIRTDSCERDAGLMRTWLINYFNKNFTDTPVPVKPAGTDFQRLVWSLLLRIPPGETRTYKQIAVEAGLPSGYRAVANAIAANPVLIAVPCHRVIGSKGELGGFRAGVERKKFLLNLESTKREES